MSSCLIEKYNLWDTVLFVLKRLITRYQTLGMCAYSPPPPLLQFSYIVVQLMSSLSRTYNHWVVFQEIWCTLEHIQDFLLNNEWRMKQYMKLGGGFNKKRGKSKHTCPIFNNMFLASSKQIKLCPRYFIFPII